MTATADDSQDLNGASQQAEIEGIRALGAMLFRISSAVRETYPPKLVQIRCSECNKMLCRAESDACLEIKCVRCGRINTFP